MIIELCNKLNKDIHDDLYHNFYNVPNEARYNQTFTSLDLIEDCQVAIQEFNSIETKGIDGRSTLFIYGALQALFCQQDGLHHLYKCVVDPNKKLNDLFDLFDFSKEIRDVRNDIAGHPTNRNNSEYYFIAKGATSKYNFTYAGYTPEFRKVEVDLKLFLTQQEDFTSKVLLEVEKNIAMKIEKVKENHNQVILVEIYNEMSSSTQLISRGINDIQRNFQGDWGITAATDTIEKLRVELNRRYNGVIPPGIKDTLRSLDYILKRFRGWFDNGELLKNEDAEIFLDSFIRQDDNLREMLIEIDEIFHKKRL